ncbi:hypothetical protein [Xenorhabdus hominickii]|uniref:Uncharacterized protein n=1 Tax=Xenorhabdus hominickii TaxID=351679 RepID=A0A2G0PYJ9_XENHO|nr:hypothetical protein [Xenorhabdus hominickii]AOM39997.1 hypothetical protein A9255_05055 [Xenorhabdus hominickii]PHM52037.1 hypothetical protein Xhom_04686 [Xenorhabdus hominickii]
MKHLTSKAISETSKAHAITVALGVYESQNTTDPHILASLKFSIIDCLDKAKEAIQKSLDTDETNNTINTIDCFIGEPLTDSSNTRDSQVNTRTSDNIKDSLYQAHTANRKTFSITR